MFYKTESASEPQTVDTTSSKVYNYVRKNIEKVNRDNASVYTYDEIKIPKEQWHLYEQNEALKAENESLNDMMLSLVEVIDNR